MACLLCSGRSGPVCAGCEPEIALRARLVERQGLTGVSVVDYSPKVAELISAFKEQGQTTLAAGFAAAMKAAIATVGRGVWLHEHPVLVPIPSHPESNRGFSPAAELAKALAPRLKLTWLDALRLESSVADQAGLTAEQRSKNLIGSMTAKSWLRNRPVLLVDDLVTTGSTLREGSRAVSANGCQVVGFITFAETLKKTLTQ